MTTTFEQIRGTLAQACEGVGLNCVGYVTDDIATPAAVIARGQINYDVSMGRGLDELAFTVTVYVDRTDEIEAQRLLDEWCEPGHPNMLKTVLEDDSVAAAAGAHYVRVRTASETQVAPFGSISYLSVEFELEVVVDGV